MWKDSKEQQLTYDELVKIVEDPRSRLHQKIGRRSATLRGTRPYWREARDELEAIVLGTRIPSVFFTLSAADLQWHDLYQNLPAPLKEEYFASSEEQRARMAATFVQQNPLLVADWLVLRFRTFLNTVLKKVLPIQHHWYRFYW